MKKILVVLIAALFCVSGCLSSTVKREIYSFFGIEDISSGKFISLDTCFLDLIGRNVKGTADVLLNSCEKLISYQKKKANSFLVGDWFYFNRGGGCSKISVDFYGAVSGGFCENGYMNAYKKNGGLSIQLSCSPDTMPDKCKIRLNKLNPEEYVNCWRDYNESKYMSVADVGLNSRSFEMEGYDSVGLKVIRYSVTTLYKDQNICYENLVKAVKDEKINTSGSNLNRQLEKYRSDTVESKQK